MDQESSADAVVLPVGAGAPGTAAPFSLALSGRFLGDWGRGVRD